MNLTYYLIQESLNLTNYLIQEILLSVYTQVTLLETVKSLEYSRDWSQEPPPPGGVFYLLCSLIKSRV